MFLIDNASHLISPLEITGVFLSPLSECSNFLLWYCQIAVLQKSDLYHIKRDAYAYYMISKLNMEQLYLVGMGSVVKNVCLLLPRKTGLENLLHPKA